MGLIRAPSGSVRWLPRARRVGHAAVLLWAAGVLFAQDAGPVPTSIAAVLTYPRFFHARTVLVQGTPEAMGRSWRIPGPDEGGLYILSTQPLPAGRVDLVCQVVDVGRLGQNDPRVAASGIEAALEDAHVTEWPRSGQFVACLVRSAAPAAPFPAPSVRALALDPARYAEQDVTISGQFRGNNLYGDLPDAPGAARWAFVLRANGAAVWVIGLRPRGRGFDFDPSSRVDTDRWLEVSGRVRQGRGLVWLEGKTVQEVAAPAAQPAPPPPPSAPPPAPEVLFSVPTEGETDVAVTTTIRIQISRGIDPNTIEGHVRVTYAGAREGQEAQRPPAPAASYDAANRVIELRFPKPLERFRTVRVDLLDGIVSTDGQPLEPWSLTFSLGG